jgi:hypothetical protein
MVMHSFPVSGFIIKEEKEKARVIAFFCAIIHENNNTMGILRGEHPGSYS